MNNSVNICINRDVGDKRIGDLEPGKYSLGGIGNRNNSQLPGVLKQRREKKEAEERIKARSASVRFSNIKSKMNTIKEQLQQTSKAFTEQKVPMVLEPKDPELIKIERGEQEVFMSLFRDD